MEGVFNHEFALGRMQFGYCIYLLHTDVWMFCLVHHLKSKKTCLPAVCMVVTVVVMVMVVDVVKVPSFLDAEIGLICG